MPFRSPRSLAWRASQTLSGTLLVSLVSALSVPALHAQETATESAYDRALNAYLEADFESARRLLDEAFQDPSTSLAALANAYALLAVLLETEGAPGARVEGQIDFAVSIDRTVAVPPGVSRAFTQRFEDVRAARTADAPSLQVERQATQATARMTNAPEGLVTAIALTCEAEGPVSATEASEAHVEAASAIQSCTATARDTHGHILFRAEHDYRIDVGPSTPIVNPAQDDTLWIVLGVVGGVLVIGGAITIGILASPRDAMLGAPTVMGWP